ncbi:Molybdenum import ATP-binding protein ModC [Roseovarius sp. EC-HK134]|uniref:molybdenum ABC transporter ATP-binding protein n=1 Tax=unclassified Roseovarius TaxID=2614913 RepID=UPI001254D91A|nr:MULTISPECIES: molybdenum ABC transporter ATP-binding protein [unclassified Roseovarius]VVS96810.1 Molybdenum import ATP-binding protein ModC [Roseovarius sp. EC-HK134]VVT00058.1 Molybdenum import ATP-binding protein ModC [Roseovarius sp. EC-SD190]
MALEVMAKADLPIPLDISFRVEPGELLALVGHSGSGKTTLLRTIAGLWRPEVARVTVNGTAWLDTAARVDLPTHQRRVGVVFQNYALFPHMMAVQNVMAAMDTPDRDEAARILDLVNLHGLADRKPAQLSGGQQQRVAVAQALARRPEALLLDEPFSAVDRATREKLYAEIIELRASLAMPVVLVTHDMNEAQLLADRMVVIDQGSTVRAGTTAEVMAEPDALRAMGIREVAAMLPAVVIEHFSDGLTRLDAATGPLFLPGVDAAPGTRVRVRIMAHEVILSRARPEGLSAQNILAGTVTSVVPGAGPGVIVHVAIGAGEILARITRRAAEQLGLAQGDTVHAILKSMSIARDHVARAPEKDQSE